MSIYPATGRTYRTSTQNHIT
ncbi:hypothetical protein F383_35484 [Gossypium arboreum]|uniref:Uncharacterized protein n=1 Tax=Gossypium arboreum TaxID=29729 RepID=A0A0B0PS67_GOSAR|nr:hypothetical protein F383_35484 [Gossypium arboreum]